jgi:hypothetical protein
MTLNPYVWLPHFEFTLQTIAVQYPKKPNEVTKKKYYEFISNIPVFFPIKPLGKSFSNMLNKYPVTPYLDSRTAFMKWTHFTINKLKEKLELPQENFYESLEKYYHNYKPKEIIDQEIYDSKKKYIEGGAIIILIAFIYYIYNND